MDRSAVFQTFQINIQNMMKTVKIAIVIISIFRVDTVTMFYGATFIIEYVFGDISKIRLKVKFLDCRRVQDMWKF